MKTALAIGFVSGFAGISLRVIYGLSFMTGVFISTMFSVAGLIVVAILTPSTEDE